MSHSLHRIGDKENLKNDFVILVRPERGINGEGSSQKNREILQILENCKAINITSARGENYKGNIYECSLDEIMEGIKDGESIYAAFDNQKYLEEFLKIVIEKDFGLSIVVQGICDVVDEVLKKVGLKVHTANHSLGIWGKTEKLPAKNILEITTMCGHGVVSPFLTKKVIGDVKKGLLSSYDGAVMLSKCCICGIFNTTRAEELIKKMI